MTDSVDNDLILIEINYVNKLKPIKGNIFTVTLNNYHKEWRRILVI